MFGHSLSTTCSFFSLSLAIWTRWAIWMILCLASPSSLSHNVGHIQRPGETVTTIYWARSLGFLAFVVWEGGGGLLVVGFFCLFVFVFVWKCQSQPFSSCMSKVRLSERWAELCIFLQYCQVDFNFNNSTWIFPYFILFWFSGWFFLCPFFMFWWLFQ